MQNVYSQQEFIIYAYMKWFAHLFTAKCSQTSMVPQNHSFLFIYSLPMETAQQSYNFKWLRWI